MALILLHLVDSDLLCLKPTTKSWHAGGPALLQWHLLFSIDTSVEGNISKYRAQVNRGMTSTKAVYLDTNYWIQLRDAEIVKGTAASVALLSRLRSLVSARMNRPGFSGGCLV